MKTASISPATRWVDTAPGGRSPWSRSFSPRVCRSLVEAALPPHPRYGKIPIWAFHGAKGPDRQGGADPENGRGDRQAWKRQIHRVSRQGSRNLQCLPRRGGSRVALRAKEKVGAPVSYLSSGQIWGVLALRLRCKVLFAAQAACIDGSVLRLLLSRVRDLGE